MRNIKFILVYCLLVSFLYGCESNDNKLGVNDIHPSVENENLSDYSVDFSNFDSLSVKSSDYSLQIENNTEQSINFENFHFKDSFCDFVTSDINNNSENKSLNFVGLNEYFSVSSSDFNNFIIDSNNFSIVDAKGNINFELCNNENLLNKDNYKLTKIVINADLLDDNKHSLILKLINNSVTIDSDFKEEFNITYTLHDSNSNQDFVFLVICNLENGEYISSLDDIINQCCKVFDLN